MKPFVISLLSFLVVGCGSKSSDVQGTMASTKYQVGQIWNYQTRQGEESSQIIIVKVEPDKKLGMIYHIYIDGLRIPNPHLKTGIQDSLPHCPVSEKTLDDSVTMLTSRIADPLPDISSGYANWKEAFDSGEGGIFTMPVKEIIQSIEFVLSEGAKKS